MPQTILIVEDELHIRTLLEQTLEELEDEADVTILSAADGEAGLAQIKAERPDVVFLDIMMPRKNGYEICREVMDDPELARSTKVVLLTAKGQEADRRKGLEAGACEYMTKPFDPDEVVLLARKLLHLA